MADRLHAAAVLYYAAQLDRLCLFTVADRVVRLFADGLLALPASALVRAYAQASIQTTLEQPATQPTTQPDAG